MKKKFKIGDAVIITDSNFENKFAVINKKARGSFDWEVSITDDEDGNSETYPVTNNELKHATKLHKILR